MIDFNEKTINVLGTSYSIYIKNKFNDDDLKNNALAYTDFHNKKIVVNDLNMVDEYVNYTEEGKQKKYNLTLRHEIIHAYLYESGLDNCSIGCNAWSRNEEMIDWLAMQLPKIYDTYCELGIMER